MLPEGLSRFCLFVAFIAIILKIDSLHSLIKNLLKFQVGAKILEAEAFPSVLYDQVQDLDDLGKIVAVEREVQEDSTDSGAPQSEDFGLTTPRKSSEPPVLNKRLGIYQRPMSAHGVRNQQDSTFSLAGGYGHDGGIGSPKRAVKINAPPGGSSMAFW